VLEARRRADGPGDLARQRRRGFADGGSAKVVEMQLVVEVGCVVDGGVVEVEVVVVWALAHNGNIGFLNVELTAVTSPQHRLAGPHGGGGGGGGGDAGRESPGRG
jgi:hypothetical protein